MNASPAHITQTTVHVTRIANACVLLEIGPYTILTDPWFRRPWGFTETPGIAPVSLPKVDVILGSHGVRDHWDLSALKGLPNLMGAEVLTATRRMARRARRLGFRSSRHMAWGDAWHLDAELHVEVVECHRALGMQTANYVITCGDVRVFFGGEARDIEPLVAYRCAHAAVDLAILPVNGMHLLGMPLVMNARGAVEAAKVLGARTMLPIHDCMRTFGISAPTSSSDELAPDTQGVKILKTAPGERFEIT